MAASLETSDKKEESRPQTGMTDSTAATIVEKKPEPVKKPEAKKVVKKPTNPLDGPTE